MRPLPITPGPWYTAPAGDGMVHIKTAGGKVVASVSGFPTRTQDAALIASAPVLFGVLQRIMWDVPPSVWRRDIYLTAVKKRALQALALAEGEVVP